MQVWVQGVIMMDILLMVVFTEGVVNLIFMGTVLQPFREFVIRNTPTIFVVREEHLLLCKLCTSVWVGLLSYNIFPINNLKWFFYTIVIHRLSNYLHLIIGRVEDIKFDKQVARKNLHKKPI